MGAPLLIGAAVMGGTQLAGTGLQMYGQRQQQQAMQRALAQYRDAANAHFDGEQAALRQNMAESNAERKARLGSIGQYVNDYRLQDSAVADPSQVQADLQATQQQVAQGGPVSNWMSQGAAGTNAAGANAQAQQADMTMQANAVNAKSLIAAWQQRQQQLAKDEAATKLALREMLSGERRSSMAERQQLSAALRQLAWERQQVQLQSAMNAAQGAGGHMQMAGSLLGAGGGALGQGLMAYGAGGGGGGAPAGTTGGVRAPVGNELGNAYSGGAGYNAFYDPGLAGTRMA